MYKRMNIYRNEDLAKKIAKETSGEFLNKTFIDEFGAYWCVFWR